MTDDISQSEYNRQFLGRLKARRPDLVSMVETAVHKGVEYMKIEIPPPPGQEESILISTYGPELTLFYHDHHTHFDTFRDGDAQAEFDNFFDYVDAFMEEKLVSVSEFDGGRWCGSSDVSPDDPVEPKENRQIIVKSWKGTYSRTVE